MKKRVRKEKKKTSIMYVERQEEGSGRTAEDLKKKRGREMKKNKRKQVLGEETS